MLYVANFSYSNYDDEFENACLMPAVVDAPDYDTAAARFRAMLQKLHSESPLLDGAESIYLDSIVELSQAPTEPVLIQWQKLVASDDGLYSDVVPLPGDDEIARVCNMAAAEDTEGERVALVDDDEDAPAEGTADADEELGPDDLADAITEALDLLFGGDFDYLDDDASANEEPFITFED